MKISWPFILECKLLVDHLDKSLFALLYIESIITSGKNKESVGNKESRDKIIREDGGGREKWIRRPYRAVRVLVALWVTTPALSDYIKELRIIILDQEIRK